MPFIVLKHDPASVESGRIKFQLEDEWEIPEGNVDTYLVNTSIAPDIAREATAHAGVPDECPQIFLFADGVTMYDESKDLINARKIRIALKIVLRTFKWLETRV